jgi:hypothetical protein
LHFFAVDDGSQRAQQRERDASFLLRRSTITALLARFYDDLRIA